MNVTNLKEIRCLPWNSQPVDPPSPLALRDVGLSSLEFRQNLPLRCLGGVELRGQNLLMQRCCCGFLKDYRNEAGRTWQMKTRWQNLPFPLLLSSSPSFPFLLFLSLSIFLLCWVELSLSLSLSLSLFLSPSCIGWRRGEMEAYL